MRFAIIDLFLDNLPLKIFVFTVRIVFRSYRFDELFLEFDRK